MTNASGAVIERYRYDAYGKRTVLTANGTIPQTESSFANQIGFTGRYEDAESGLVYFKARQYSTTLGRFLSRDPMGYISGPSLYSAYFVPNATDPLGLFPAAPGAPSVPVEDDAGSWCCSDKLQYMEIRVKLPAQRVKQLKNMRALLDREAPPTGHAYLALPGFSAGFYPVDGFWGGGPGKVDRDDDSDYHFFQLIQACPSTVKCVTRAIEQDRNSPPVYDLRAVQCTTWALRKLQNCGVRGLPEAMPTLEPWELSESTGMMPAAPRDQADPRPKFENVPPGPRPPAPDDAVLRQLQLMRDLMPEQQ
ncbi:MAG: RHS repeat-associated core domain-containing protein [Planctomycetes bacterium]|nr:RHS repeat-associated core domain-containing protein [Planctomycetota bacterium]